MGNEPQPQAGTSGERWQYYKFGMSQMHCSNVGDEPMSKNTGQCLDLTMIQVDLIQIDDKPADSCAISPMTLTYRIWMI